MDFALLQENGVGALPQFLTSLAIGLLIGLERERNPSAKAGLRTFALVAVFGTLSALLSDKLGTPWMLVAGMIAVAGMIVAAYINSPTEENDPGTTTVIALLLSYGLGAMIWYGLATLAVMLAIGITTLLYFKPELRGISQRLTRRDLVAVLQFSVLTFIVLPILPDQSYGPYGAFNPHQAWLMVVLISGLSLTGYAALQVVGTRYGAPLLGLFGGLASSTATTLIYSKHGKSNLAMQSLAASVIVIASMVVLVRLFVVSSVLAYGSLPALIPLFAGGLFAGFQEFVSPESFGLMESVMVLCMVVLGGMGNIAGVILGGVLLALLPEILRHSVVPLQQALFGKTLVDPESLRMLLFGSALIVMMLYRPAGLWPSRVRRRELDTDEAAETV